MGHLRSLVNFGSAKIILIFSLVCLFIPTLSSNALGYSRDCGIKGKRIFSCQLQSNNIVVSICSKNMDSPDPILVYMESRNGHRELFFPTDPKNSNQVRIETASRRDDKGVFHDRIFLQIKRGDLIYRITERVTSRNGDDGVPNLLQQRGDLFIIQLSGNSGKKKVSPLSQVDCTTPIKDAKANYTGSNARLLKYVSKGSFFDNKN